MFDIDAVKRATIAVSAKKGDIKIRASVQTDTGAIDGGEVICPSDDGSSRICASFSTTAREPGLYVQFTVSDSQARVDILEAVNAFVSEIGNAKITIKAEANGTETGA